MSIKRITKSKGISQTVADTRYLKLDCTNQPLTGYLDIDASGTGIHSLHTQDYLPWNNTNFHQFTVSWETSGTYPNRESGSQLTFNRYNETGGIADAHLFISGDGFNFDSHLKPAHSVNGIVDIGEGLSGDKWRHIYQRGSHYLDSDTSYSYWGSSQDLKIGHNGTKSIIQNNTGDLFITADSGLIDFDDENLLTTGNISGANLNITNWDTAYGWGNHADQNYFDIDDDTLDNVPEGTTYNRVTAVHYIDLTDGGDTILHDHDGISENTTHRSSNGSDHSFIDQSVISGATPTFSADNFSDGGGNAIITTTQETNFATAYTHSQDNSQAHSDYLINNGNDTTTGTLTADGGFVASGNENLTGLSITRTQSTAWNPAINAMKIVEDSGGVTQYGPTHTGVSYEITQNSSTANAGVNGVSSTINYTGGVCYSDSYAFYAKIDVSASANMIGDPMGVGVSYALDGVANPAPSNKGGVVVSAAADRASAIYGAYTQATNANSGGLAVGYQGYGDNTSASSVTALNSVGLFGYGRSIGGIFAGVYSWPINNNSKHFAYVSAGGHNHYTAGVSYFYTNTAITLAVNKTHINESGDDGSVWVEKYLEVDNFIYADGGITIAGAKNIVLNTTTGTKIGTATSQKLGFYNATPVVQQTGCAVPTDLASSITAITVLRTALNNLGLTTVVAK